MMTVLSHFRLLAFVLAVVAGQMASSGSARAQGVAAFVNGDAITNHDVEQRARINRLSGQRGVSSKSALSDLIDDKLKILEARRIGYRLNEDNVDDQMARIASSNRQTMPEFIRNLAKAGIDSNAYRAKLRADYSWELAQEHKKRGGSSGVNNFDSVIVRKGSSAGVTVTDYTLRSVIFVIPTGSSPAQRINDAEAARRQFDDCTTGMKMLRSLRDVALRAPVRRTSSSLSPELAGLLEKTPLNRMTQPMRSDQGIEMIAVCEKTDRLDTSAGSSGKADAEKNRQRNDADDYLKSLRAKAVIQYR